MARRVLALLLLLISASFAHDFEYIKTVFDGNEITSAYVDSKEVVAFLGHGQESLEKAVSAISQLQLLGELNYSLKDLTWKKKENQSVLYWDTEKVVVFSELEKRLNDGRGNNIVKAASLFANSSSEFSKVSIKKDTKQGLANKMILIKTDLISYDGVLPATHAYYPLGTLLRLKNTKTDWTVVVKIVDNQKNLADNELGVGDNALKALGIGNGKKVRVQTM